MMVNEAYAECLVKRKVPSSAVFVKLLLAALVVLSAGSVLIIGMYGFLVFLFMCGVTSLVLSGMHVEYEYLFVDKKFSVDKIFNKSRRKSAGEYPLEEIAVIGPEKAGKIMEFDRQVKKVTDYTSGRLEANRYAFIVQRGGVCEKVIFEPDEKMIHCLKMSAPGKMA